MAEPNEPEVKPKTGPQVLESSRLNRLQKVFGLFIAIIVIFLVLLSTQVDRYVRTSYCLKCHSEYAQMKSLPFVHAAFKVKACTACHTSHGKMKIVWTEYASILMKYIIGVGGKEGGRTTVESGKAGQRPKDTSKLVKPEKQLCNDCHQGERFRSWEPSKYKHPPYKMGTCTACHDAHASKYIAVTKERPDRLCIGCHNITARMRKKVLHPPFKAKRCADCHEPHASNVENHLRLPQKYLCRTCHPKIAQLFKLPYKMEPFEKGQCTKCHNPHSSDYKKLWQKGPTTQDMCFSCHDGSDGSNIKQYSTATYQMQPFKEGKCLKCHKPHATSNPKLLQGKGNDFCYKCHSEYKKNYLPISHNKVSFNKDSPNSPEHGKGSCLNCHVPHGTDNFGLVYKEIISLCTTCHKPGEYRGYKRNISKPHIAHPVGLDISDPWRGHYLRCSSCHNPMGSDHSKLRREKDDGLCLKCHNANDPRWIKGRPEPTG